MHRRKTVGREISAGTDNSVQYCGDIKVRSVLSHLRQSTGKLFSRHGISQLEHLRLAASVQVRFVIVVQDRTLLPRIPNGKKLRPVAYSRGNRRPAGDPSWQSGKVGDAHGRERLRAAATNLATLLVAGR